MVNWRWPLSPQGRIRAERLLQLNVDSRTLTATLGGLSKLTPISLSLHRVPQRNRRHLGGPESHMAELKAVAGRIAVVREREADQPHSPVAIFGTDQPLRLDAGVD